MENYPHSFKFFRETVYPNTSIMNRSILSLYHIRYLYYFFDSVGIVMTVECLTEYSWVGTVQLRSGFVFSIPGTHRNRLDLELSGFVECFSQLNKRLISLNKKYLD